MSEEEYREWGRSIAMDILDDSCFDGDIGEFL